jgi:5-methylcytosine-specific restriction protein B
MAKFYETVNAPIYALGQRLLTDCLQKDGSLITEDAPIWTLANLDKLDEKFVRNIDNGDGGFLDKLPGQIQDAGDNVCALFAELLAVYFLFPAGTGPVEKKHQVNMVLNWAHRSVPAGGLLDRALDQSIGGAGPAFAYNKPYEIAFLIRFARAWKNAPE